MVIAYWRLYYWRLHTDIQITDLSEHDSRLEDAMRYQRMPHYNVQSTITSVAPERTACSKVRIICHTNCHSHPSFLFSHLNK